MIFYDLFYEQQEGHGLRLAIRIADVAFFQSSFDFSSDIFICYRETLNGVDNQLVCNGRRRLEEVHAPLHVSDRNVFVDVSFYSVVNANIVFITLENFEDGA